MKYASDAIKKLIAQLNSDIEYRRQEEKELCNTIFEKRMQVTELEEVLRGIEKPEITDGCCVKEARPIN